MQASNFGGTLTNFSLEFFHEIFTEDASLLLLYHGAKKVKHDQKLKSRGSCLKTLFSAHLMIMPRHVYSQKVVSGLLITLSVFLAFVLFQGDSTTKADRVFSFMVGEQPCQGFQQVSNHAPKWPARPMWKTEIGRRAWSPIRNTFLWAENGHTNPMENSISPCFGALSSN